MAAVHGRSDPPAGQDPAAGSAAVRGARERRLALGDAMTRTEQALTVPSGSPTWRQEVGDALAAVRAALDDHVSEVEGEAGLLDELRQLAPRLSAAAAQLEREHPPLCAQAEAALAAVPAAPVDEVRATALELLTALSRHRQRGADLVYEAYNVDIGGQ